MIILFYVYFLESMIIRINSMFETYIKKLMRIASSREAV